jgi:CBS domain-containing protein
MPYEIRELLKGLPKPVTARPDEPLEDALNLMLEHNYSQLPVVEGSGHSSRFYLITANKILETLRFLGLPISTKGLKVSQALVKVPVVFMISDTITDVMEGLRERDAVLIVNEQGDLQNIVTMYDTTHFFRQWSEDLLNARDIEMTLRRIINGSFKRSDGSIDVEARQKAIDGASSEDGEVASRNAGLRRFQTIVSAYLAQQATVGVQVDRRKAFKAFEVLLQESQPSAPVVGTASNDHLEDAQNNLGSAVNSGPTALPSTTIATQLQVTRDLRSRFVAAIQCYLQLTAPSPEPNSDWINAAYRQHHQDKQEARDFNKLTLGAYIDLFFHEQCWGRCKEAFDFDQGLFKRVLKDVQDTRNLLAHFREEEITKSHRHNLHLAAHWFPQYEKKALTKLDETAPSPIEQKENLDSFNLGSEGAN